MAKDDKVPDTIADYIGIKVGDEFFQKPFNGKEISKSTSPYEVTKDAGWIWYFVMFDGSGSDISRVQKSMTIEEFYEKWERVTPEVLLRIKEQDYA